MKASIDEIFSQRWLPHSGVISLIFTASGSLKSQFQRSRRWIFTSGDINLCCGYESPVHNAGVQLSCRLWVSSASHQPSGYWEASRKYIWRNQGVLESKSRMAESPSFPADENIGQFLCSSTVCRGYLQRKHTIRVESTGARALPLIYQGCLWWLLIEMPALKFCAQPHV